MNPLKRCRFYIREPPALPPARKVRGQPNRLWPLDLQVLYRRTLAHLLLARGRFADRCLQVRI